MTDPLKPCPFCGGGEVQQWEDYVTCNDCHSQGPPLPGATCDGEIVSAWNRRAVQSWSCDPPAVPGDYLTAYRFSPEDEWTQGRQYLAAGQLPVLPDTSETRWFGPIPPIEGGA